MVFGLAGLGAVGLILLALVAADADAGNPTVLGWGIWASVLGLGGSAALTYSSIRGKVRVRDRVLAELALVGNEDVLDLGCGSGLMLLGAAQRLTTGTATGLDRWRLRDQAGGGRDRCLRNAAVLGVSDRVRLLDGDLTALPVAGSSFDVVLASLAVHNVHPRSLRAAVIAEAGRVLRPGGRLVIVDIFGTRAYLAAATAAGLVDVRRSGVVAGIVPPARIVTAAKPH